MQEEKIQLIESLIDQLINTTRGEADNYTLTIIRTPSKVSYLIKPKKGKPIEGEVSF